MLYRSRQTGRAQIVNGSWKDNPKAKKIAATISLLLIAGLIAVLAFALLSMQ